MQRIAYPPLPPAAHHHHHQHHHHSRERGHYCHHGPSLVPTEGDRPVRSDVSEETEAVRRLGAVEPMHTWIDGWMHEYIVM